MDKKGNGGIGITVSLIIIAFFIVIAIIISGFDTVDASHVGVKNRFGVIQGTMQPGMAWTGLFVHVEQYDLRMRKMTVEMLENEKTAVDIDGQTIKARIEINYRINPENIEQAYSTIGRQAEMAAILNLDGIIREGFKTITSKYKSKEIWQNRQKIKEESISTITSNFPEDFFKLENVIISDIDFNPEFINAIELQKTNEELAIAAEKAVVIATQEANAKIESARGTAESNKLAAEATAYKIKVDATANAFKVREVARAEAEALAMKKKELTSEMLYNNWIDAWDGKLPQYVITTSEGSNMLMQLPTK